LWKQNYGNTSTDLTDSMHSILIYLDIYKTAYMFTSSHNVSYTHQLSTFKSLFPRLQSTSSLPFTLNDAVKCHVSFLLCWTVWTVRWLCYCIHL